MNTTMNYFNNTFSISNKVCADCFAGTPFETWHPKYINDIINEVKKELAIDHKKAIESYTCKTTLLDNKEVIFDIEIKTKDAEIFLFEAKLNKVNSNGVEYADEKDTSIVVQLCNDVIKYLEQDGKEILHISSKLNELEKSSVVKAAFIVA